MVPFKEIFGKDFADHLFDAFIPVKLIADIKADRKYQKHDEHFKEAEKEIDQAEKEAYSQTYRFSHM